MFKKYLMRAVFAVVLPAILCTGSFASVGDKTASLEYNDVKIFLDGNIVLPSDANGNYVEPFLIDGTTYLPVRAIGNAMGLSVGWNNETNTVTLSSSGEVVRTGAVGIHSSGPRRVEETLSYNNIKVSLNGAVLSPVDNNGNPVEPFIINGTTYLPVRGIASALGLNVNWDSMTSTVTLTTKSVQSSGASSNGSIPTGWVKVDGASLSFLLNGAASGRVVYRDGQYWATPEYVSMYTNENIVSSVDISGGTPLTPEQEYIKSFNANTKVEILVGIEALSKIEREIFGQRLRESIESNSDFSNAIVSDIEVLQYCMPSLPDDFLTNPVEGTYDGIRVVIRDGKVMMYQSDLIAKGFLE